MIGGTKATAAPLPLRHIRTGVWAWEPVKLLLLTIKVGYSNIPELAPGMGEPLLKTFTKSRLDVNL